MPEALLVLALVVVAAACFAAGIAVGFVAASADEVCEELDLSDLHPPLREEPREWR